ncbi:MAG: AEC family transporter, partial [Spirochaetota bacterium]
MTLPASTIQTFILFLLMSAGFAAGKTSILDETTVKKLSRFLVNFVLPCLIVASMQQPLTPELRMEALRTLGISFAIYAASFPLAFGFASLIRAKGATRGVHAFAGVFANVAFMGFPVQQALFGKAVLFQASIFIIPFNLLAFSVGAAMIAGGARSGGPAPSGATAAAGPATHEARLSWRSFVNPAGVSSVVGFALFLADFRLPLPLFRAMSILGDTTTPLAMCIIGATLAETNLGNTLRD